MILNHCIKQHRFYFATITKMLKKFPIGDSILRDLGIIHPDKVATYPFETIKSCQAISTIG